MIPKIYGRSLFIQSQTNKATGNDPNHALNGTTQDIMSRPEERSKTKTFYNYLNPSPSRPVRRPPPIDDLYSQLEKVLSKISRTIDLISGDGNCLFRALSRETFGSERFYNWMRNRIVDFMETHANLFIGFLDCNETIESHVAKMRINGVWATTMELFAAATYLSKTIYLFTPAISRRHYQWYHFRPLCGRRKGISYMALCHTRAEHFDRIIPYGEFDNRHYPPPMSRGNFLKYCTRLG